MTVQHVTDPNTPIGEVLAAATDGILVEGKDQNRFAIIPLDDDLIEYLLERSPRFVEDCRRIRAEMSQGKSVSHDEVRRLFSQE